MPKEVPHQNDAPFLPYGRQAIDDADIAAVVAALRSDFLTTGPRVADFERALSECVEAPDAVAVCNGTAALHAAYSAAGVGPGDEVIVPAITFLATANAARFLGAEPVFADVDPDTGLVTPEAIRHQLTSRTRAVVPVHMTGMPADLHEIAALLDSNRTVIVEDAAHALGAEYEGRRIGSCAYSSLTIFSFHPVKHVTTAEGGAVTARDPILLERVRRFRNHGMVQGSNLQEKPAGPWYYEQQDLGFNYRITDIQCALGTSQLAKLDRFLSRRRELALHYDQLLAAVPHVRPVATPRSDRRSAYHLYSVLIDFDAVGRTRAEVVAALRERGIGTQVHYIPVPSQPYYRSRGNDPAKYPGARRYYERTLSLPLYPDLTLSDVERVVASAIEVLK